MRGYVARKGHRWHAVVYEGPSSPTLRNCDGIPKVEPQAWTAQQLQAFFQATAGHRLFPAF
jgi:hypothetical protein